MSTGKAAGSRVGDELVAAFREMAAHVRGELELEGYELTLADDVTPARRTPSPPPPSTRPKARRA